MCVCVCVRVWVWVYACFELLQLAMANLQAHMCCGAYVGQVMSQHTSVRDSALCGRRLAAVLQACGRHCRPGAKRISRTAKKPKQPTGARTHNKHTHTHTHTHNSGSLLRQEVESGPQRKVADEAEAVDGARCADGHLMQAAAVGGPARGGGVAVDTLSRWVTYTSAGHTHTAHNTHTHTHTKHTHTQNTHTHAHRVDKGDHADAVRQLDGDRAGGRQHGLGRHRHRRHRRPLPQLVDRLVVDPGRAAGCWEVACCICETNKEIHIIVTAFVMCGWTYAGDCAPGANQLRQGN